MPQYTHINHGSDCVAATSTDEDEEHSQAYKIIFMLNYLNL